MSTELNESIVIQFHGAIERGSGTTALSFLAADATWWTPTDQAGGAPKTKDDIQLVFGPFMQAFETLPRLDLLSLTAEQDCVVMEKAARDGVTRDGAKYDNDYAMVFRLRDGMIVAVREYFDPRQAAPLFAEIQPD